MSRMERGDAELQDECKMHKKYCSQKAGAKTTHRRAFFCSVTTSRSDYCGSILDVWLAVGARFPLSQHRGVSAQSGRRCRILCESRCTSHSCQTSMLKIADLWEPGVELLSIPRLCLNASLAVFAVRSPLHRHCTVARDLNFVCLAVSSPTDTDEDIGPGA